MRFLGLGAIWRGPATLLMDRYTLMTLKPEQGRGSGIGDRSQSPLEVPKDASIPQEAVPACYVPNGNFLLTKN